MTLHDGMDEFYTPQAIVGCLPTIDLDPCAEMDCSIPAAKHFAWPDKDGLTLPWHGTVFMNPPYSTGSLPKWTRKAKEEVESGRADCVIGLLPSRPGSIYWSLNVHGHADVGLLLED